VTKQDWGTKRVCLSCATKFYDFARTPIVCPKCETTFDPDVLLKSRRNRPAAAKPVKAVTKPPKRVDLDDDSDDEEDIDLGDDVADIDDDDEDVVLDDTSDLDGDDVKTAVGVSETEEAEDR